MPTPAYWQRMAAQAHMLSRHFMDKANAWADCDAYRVDALNWSTYYQISAAEYSKFAREDMGIENV